MLSRKNGTTFEETILALTRLDAFNATAIAGLRADVLDTVGGRQEKLTLETFSNFLPLAYNQRFGVVQAINFCLDALSIKWTGEPTDLLVKQKVG